MHLLVGLGNFGKEYELTRHNFGFLLLDKIIEDNNFDLKGTKFKSEIFSGRINDERVVAIKPQTYMNKSGIAVGEVAKFYKIPIKNIIVLHDDVDLEMGRIRSKIGGGTGGHNGLKSIDEIIGKNYTRIRLGVGRPENKNFDTADYVLQKFSHDELKKVEEINEKISNDMKSVLNGDLEGFLNKFYI